MATIKVTQTIITILLIGLTESQNLVSTNETSTNSTQSTSTTESISGGYSFEGNPEIVRQSVGSVELKVHPISKSFRDQVQAYYVIVDSVESPSSHDSRNYSLTKSQSEYQRLSYYAAIKLAPTELTTSKEMIIGNGNSLDTTYTNPPLGLGQAYRFGLAAEMRDNTTFYYVQTSGTVTLHPTASNLIELLTALFGGLIVILLLVIAGLIYYLREAEVDVRWQDVVMIWSKRHRSSLFKDRNKAYQRCEGNRFNSLNKDKLLTSKYLSTSTNNRLHSNSYINMEVEHHLIDIPTLIVSLTDPAFINILTTEFNAIPFIHMPSIDGTKPENRKKNRYIYLPAFDFNRVKLIVDGDEVEDEELNGSKEDDGDESTAQMSPNVTSTLKPTDYINASYIDGYNRLKCYIATQGPLPWTFNDFWKMMWQQDCGQIVMLTGLIENGRIKCDRYWPEDGKSVSYGKITVEHSSSNSDADGHVIRRFTMTKGDESRKVILYHYINWPDHGAPADPEPLINLIETINSDGKQLPNQGPIVTHCSAGVGRTGTYIMIDTMMKMGEKENSVDVLGQLYLLRKQRTHMIETEEQYNFVHRTIARYFTKKSINDAHSESTSVNEMKQEKQSTDSPLINIESDDKPTTVEP